MSVVVVVLLVLLWAWILLPGAVREHREASPATSVSRFERTMAQLARANPVRGGRAGSHRGLAGLAALSRSVPVSQLDPARRAARRRRSILIGLSVATTCCLLLARVVGGATWALFWLAALLLATYAGLVVHRWIRVSRAAAAPLVHLPEGVEPAPPVQVLAAGPPGSSGDAPTVPAPHADVPSVRAEPGAGGVPRGVRVINW